MKLVMTLLVRDEEDIIEANLDYHLSRGVDFVVATDNLSVDGTPAILERYQRQGRLHLIRETQDDYLQHVWVTRMARMAATDFAADWVINNDADEFWWPQEDANLKSCLMRVSDSTVALQVPRFNFSVTAQNPDSLPFYQVQTWRDTASENPLGKPLPHKVCHRAVADIEVAQGNHSVSLQGQRCATTSGAMEIFHYPMRSYAQFENKIRLGGAAYARNKQLPLGVGHTWRHLYQQWQAGLLPTYYQNQLPTPDQLNTFINTGRYISDHRLQKWMHDLYEVLNKLGYLPPMSPIQSGLDF